MGRTLAITFILVILTGCGQTPPARFADYYLCESSPVLLLPHHRLVENFIDAMLDTWKKQDIEKIIVLSPNHFSQGSLPVEVPNELEHGWTLYRDKLSERFPKAEIEGKMVRTGASKADLEKLVAEVKAELEDPTTRAVVTVDFSHYLPGDVAELHDIRSEDVLKALDAEDALTLEVDSPELLYVLIRLAQERSQGIQITDHTNPALDAGLDTFENTTHVYACMLPTDEIATRSLNIHMSFAKPRAFYEGKTMEDRYLYGYDSVEFNQGGQDTATVTKIETGEITQTIFSHFAH